MSTRSPIVSVLGHVDHGKSSILDAIRGSNILATEAGAITQAIGASIIPIKKIKNQCGNLLKALKLDLTIPGLLFIDTPGHAAFTTLRKRGGTLADIAILTVDINEGFKPQTREAINILKENKTPFVIAANKIDLIAGYQIKEKSIIQNIESQSERTQTEFMNKFYTLVGSLHEEFGMEAERFDKVDFTKQLAIVPTSAKQNHGIPELLMILAGLAQKFMADSLNINEKGQAKGTILEVKEDKGLGTTVDVILYDGSLKVNDTIIIPTKQGPKSTKVRALLEPAPLQEMRDKKSQFIHVKEVHAATGVKIAAPELNDVVAGMPIVSCQKEKTEEAKEALENELEEITVNTCSTGIVIKADTIGSVEALVHMLQEIEVPIAKASIGPITKKDLVDAEANGKENPTYGCILGFNIPNHESTEQVKIITNSVIYKLIEDYKEWSEAKRKTENENELEGVIKPAKIEILKNCIFRQSNPAIVGIEILEGTLTVNAPLMKERNRIGQIKSLQLEKESVKKAEKGKQLAISLPGVTAGRQIFEGDILYVDVNEEEFRKLKELKALLTESEIQAMKDTAKEQREKNPLWGV